MFQFPSNGKADPKRIEKRSAVQVRDVSIPFKRESGSKVHNYRQNHSLHKATTSFNSLQTGKRIQRPDPGDRGQALQNRFNSLQTGKRIQRFLYFLKLKQIKSLVSIPFKRESGSKAAERRAIIEEGLKGFNSLQTGKRIQSRVTATPSGPLQGCFNSLQTGKRIQSCDDSHGC